MAKLLLLLVIGGLVYWIIRSAIRKNQNSYKPDRNKPAEDMVRCVQCGVNLPRSEAVLSRDEYFCGNEHRQLHQS